MRLLRHYWTTLHADQCCNEWSDENINEDRVVRLSPNTAVTPRPPPMLPLWTLARHLRLSGISRLVGRGTVWGDLTTLSHKYLLHLRRSPGSRAAVMCHGNGPLSDYMSAHVDNTAVICPHLSQVRDLHTSSSRVLSQFRPRRPARPGQGQVRPALHRPQSDVQCKTQYLPNVKCYSFLQTFLFLR